MKYIKILGVLIIIILILGTMFTTFNSNNKYFTVNGVKLAVGVDGVIQSDFPSMGEYEVTVSCTNVTGEWNYGNWQLELSNMTNNSAVCNIEFKSIPNSRKKLNTMVIGLKGTATGNGKVINEPTTDYRYEGKDPNNYIKFNNELWRIIGVFSNNTHGQKGNLTKIIRNDSIGSYAWDMNIKNDWATSSLKTILNKYYFNKTDGSNDNNCSFYMTKVKGNCDFTQIGLNDIARNMVQTITWKLGGRGDSKVNASSFYTDERSTYPNPDNAQTTKANVGLMYPSDYGYSVLASNCPRTTNLENYNVAGCGGKSWLLKYGYEWTMTGALHPSNWTNYHSFNIVEDASLLDSNDYGSCWANSVRPVVYLKSNVYVVEGDGSINNPYVLGI